MNCSCSSCEEIFRAGNVLVADELAVVGIGGGGLGGSAVDEVIVDGRERFGDCEVEGEERETNVERERRIRVSFHWKEIGAQR